MFPTDKNVQLNNYNALSDEELRALQTLSLEPAIVEEYWRGNSTFAKFASLGLINSNWHQGKTVLSLTRLGYETAFGKLQ